METIEKSKYEGYLWYSNAQIPELLFGEEKEILLEDNKNPFVIEGWLTDGKKSIQIKYIDGKHLVKQYDLEALNGAGVLSEPKFYLPSFNGVSGLHFEQYWRPEVDVMCDDMQVLQPAEFVFVGFEK